MEGSGRYAGVASPSGFVNIEPLTRQERAATRDKDLLEKLRLEKRARGALAPQENVVGNPVVPVRNSPAYCDEYDRFNRDVAAEIHTRKQQELNRKEAIYAARRAENYHREKSNWETMQAEQEREAARYNAARSMGTGARRNAPSESYNLLSLNYSNNSSGQTLAAKDAGIQEKRQERAAALYKRDHSVGHNILTGEPLRLPLPVKQPHY